jgi:hypothetical protein
MNGRNPIFLGGQEQTVEQSCLKSFAPRSAKLMEPKPYVFLWYHLNYKVRFNPKTRYN